MYPNQLLNSHLLKIKNKQKNQNQNVTQVRFLLKIFLTLGHNLGASKPPTDRTPAKPQPPEKSICRFSSYIDDSLLFS
jgi:hypothetical protein